ncbi:MAG: hypothetical protein RL236_1401 [Pseudomonadota bacterium]
MTLTPIQLMNTEQLKLIWHSKKKTLGLTQEKVAQLCDWNTQSAFNAYLLGRIPLNTDAVLRLAKVLQVHPTEIMPELSDILPYSTSENSDQQESLSKSEKMIVNMLRSIWEEKIHFITNQNAEDLNLHYKAKQQISNQLAAAYKDITTLQLQVSSRATEFVNLKSELSKHAIEKSQRTSEILILNQKLILQSIEKEKRADELEIANIELAFQNSEKQKRADELEIANIKLAFQNTEKQKRADELEIANIELAFEKTEKEKRAIELEKVQRIATLNESFKTENEDLISEGTQKEKLVTKLKFQNSKKEKMVTQLQIANNNNQKLNQQVNHLQKVESIGRLTAGISHDFNNILGCMLGYNEMNNDIRDEMKDDALKSELDNNTKQIANAGQRAVALIDKMMTYARQNEESKIELDERTMNVKIQDVLEMLKPILTSKIQLNFVTDCDCVSYPEQDNCAIQIDTSSLHQIITNLTVNARDAMKEVGNNITISLKKVVLSDIHCMACGEMMRGEFIKLAVTDNGSGMKQKIIRRIFDPFFTTKPQGEGTGLGLSTTMGLVHSAKGHILVKSHVSGPNQGSSFQLLFPILT